MASESKTLPPSDTPKTEEPATTEEPPKEPPTTEDQPKEPPTTEDQPKEPPTTEEQPKEPPTTEEPPKEPVTTEELLKELPTEAAEPPAGEPVVDPLQAPLPQDWTIKELILKKKEDKGTLFACGFTFCCCFLCYEKLEFVLDYVCCKTCK